MNPHEVSIDENLLLIEEDARRRLAAEARVEWFVEQRLKRLFAGLRSQNKLRRQFLDVTMGTASPLAIAAAQR